MGDFAKETVEKAKRLTSSKQAEELKKAAASGARRVRKAAKTARESEVVQSAKAQSTDLARAATRGVVEARSERRARKEAADARERLEKMEKKALREKAPLWRVGAGAGATTLVVNPVTGSVYAASLILRNMYLKRDEAKQRRLRAEAGIPEAEWQAYVGRLRAEKRAADAAAKKAYKEKKRQERAEWRDNEPIRRAQDEQRQRERAERQALKREPDVEEIRAAWALIKQETEQGEFDG